MEQQYKLVVCFTSHTTATDADFVVREIERVRPDVYIPEEPLIPREKLDSMQAHYERLFSDQELRIDRPNIEFHQRLLSFLGQYSKQKTVYPYFLELCPQACTRHLKKLHESKERYEKSALNRFYRGEFDGACEDLFTTIHLHAHNVRVRANIIEENLTNLKRDINKRFPVLGGMGGILTWISGLYRPPIVHFDRFDPETEEVYQSIPYTQLTYIEVLRALACFKSIDLDILPRFFVETILDEEYRDPLPNSKDRFVMCRRVSSTLTYKDIGNLAKVANDRKRFLETLDELGISKIELPKGVGDVIINTLNLKPGPDVGKCMRLLKSAVAKGVLPSNPSVDTCIEFLKKAASNSE